MDSYDAMTSIRPYRDAMSPMEALEEIEINAGKQFDSSLVVVFLKMMKRANTSGLLSAVRTKVTT